MARSTAKCPGASPMMYLGQRHSPQRNDIVLRKETALASCSVPCTHTVTALQPHFPKKVEQRMKCFYLMHYFYFVQPHDKHICCLCNIDAVLQRDLLLLSAV